MYQSSLMQCLRDQFTALLFLYILHFFYIFNAFYSRVYWAEPNKAKGVILS